MLFFFVHSISLLLFSHSLHSFCVRKAFYSTDDHDQVEEMLINELLSWLSVDRKIERQHCNCCLCECKSTTKGNDHFIIPITTRKGALTLFPLFSVACKPYESRGWMYISRANAPIFNRLSGPWVKFAKSAEKSINLYGHGQQCDESSEILFMFDFVTFCLSCDMYNTRRIYVCVGSRFDLLPIFIAISCIFAHFCCCLCYYLLNFLTIRTGILSFAFCVGFLYVSENILTGNLLHYVHTTTERREHRE